MTVFKTFWKVVNKQKGTIILYTMLLLIFGGLNMSNKEMNMDFVNSKPDLYIINEDQEGKLTKNLVSYLEQNSHIKDIKEEEEAINDAIFYRDVNYVIYIPKNYTRDVMDLKNPELKIKSTNDYQASLQERLLSKYLETQNIYLNIYNEEEKIIEAINKNMSLKTDIEITSKLDHTKLTNASRYFNFASYSIMAVIIFVICLVMTSFKEKNIKKRIIVSEMNYKKHNRNLLFSSLLYSVIAWLLFILLGIILLKDTIFTLRGLILIGNAFLFTFCSLTIALLISNIVNNKEAVSGIVNVIALGSAFLCGAFVPAEWLPKSVLQIAHILPAYWYINTNDLIKSIEILNRETLKPIVINYIVLILFALLFILMNNFISKKKQKVG